MSTPLHLVLVQPEIPHNTGAIGRLCVGLDCELHLIRPLGFQINLANAAAIAAYEAYRQFAR